MTRLSARGLITVAVVACSVTLLGAVQAQTGSLGLQSPSWYTPSLGSKVIAAGTEGTPLPPQAAVSSIAFPGIRPGSWMVSPNWCTLNFIFNASGSLNGGPYFIGTAKHCVATQIPADPTSGSLGGFDPNENVIGKKVTAVIATKVGAPPVAVVIGAVAYSSPGMDTGADFALISIKPEFEKYISPSIAHVGGPTSTYTGKAMEPALMSGHGLGIGTGGTSRAGVLSSFNDQYPHGYGMVISAVPGDSGAPVRTLSGAAVGNVTFIGSSNRFPTGIAFGTRVSYVSSTWGLNVVTCGRADPWASTGCPTG